MKGLRPRRLKSRRRTAGAPLGAAVCVTRPEQVDDSLVAALPSVRDCRALEITFDDNPQVYENFVDPYDEKHDFLHIVFAFVVSNKALTASKHQ